MDIHAKYSPTSDADHKGARAALLAELQRIEANHPQQVLARLTKPDVQEWLAECSPRYHIERISAESLAWARSVRETLDQHTLTAARLLNFRSKLQRIFAGLPNAKPISDISDKFEAAAAAVDSTQPDTPERRQAAEKAETLCMQVAETIPGYATLLSKVFAGYQARVVAAEAKASVYKDVCAQQVQNKKPKPPKKEKAKEETKAEGVRRPYYGDALDAAIEEWGGLDTAKPCDVFMAMEGLAGAAGYLITGRDAVDNALIYYHHGLHKEKKLTLDAVRGYMRRQKDKASKERQVALLAGHQEQKRRSVA